MIFKLIKASYLTTARFFKEQYTYRASALTFTSLLALVPLFAVTVFFITKFPIFSHLIDLATAYLLKNFVPAAAHTVVGYFKNFISTAARLPTGSIIFLAVTAIMLLDTIVKSINDIWGITKKRKWLRTYITYFFILLFIPIFIGLTVFLTSFLSVVTEYFDDAFTLGISVTFLTILPIFLNTIFFSIIYIFAPNTHVNKMNGILGGFIAAVLFELARIAFTFYLTQFANYQAIYGAFAVFPIFLIWLFLCWVIFLWGALFTYTYSRLAS